MKITCKNFTAVLWKAKGGTILFLDLAETYIDNLECTSMQGRILNYQSVIFAAKYMKNAQVHKAGQNASCLSWHL